MQLALNPFALAIFLMIVAFTWLGMSLANSAIRTARIEAHKNAAILNGVAKSVVVLNEQDQVVLANPAALALPAPLQKIQQAVQKIIHNKATSVSI